MMLVAIFVAALSCNAHPQYRIRPIAAHVQVSKERAGYRAVTRVSFALQTVVPAKVPQTDPALRAHVAGHLAVARRVAASSRGRFEAIGGSSARARVRLRQAIARVTSDLQRELDREERVYENVTESGAAQSSGPSFGFPGGPDMHVLCPR